jgi:NAD dependent epimerase/dehydratase family enzyme
MSSLVLEGQYVVPKRLQEMGFKFKFEDAESALMDLYSRR